MSEFTSARATGFIGMRTALLRLGDYGWTVMVGRLGDGVLSALANLFAARYLSGQSSIDFASIRQHYTGVGGICRALDAGAFTVGSDIYFADRAFSPNTSAGLWLLAHEVAHVVQQSMMGMSATDAGSAYFLGPSGRAEERTASAAADAFIADRPFATRRRVLQGARRRRAVFVII